MEKVTNKNKLPNLYRIAAENSTHVQYVELMEGGESFGGRCFLKEGYCKAPRPNTVGRLWVYLHECSQFEKLEPEVAAFLTERKGRVRSA